MIDEALQRPEPRRLYQQIADEIRNLIRNGTFPVRSRLPAERELAHQLNVSRPSLREALIVLEVDGSVEIPMGSGVYVCKAADQLPEMTHPMGDSPSEFMLTRVVIEGTVVVQACARMTGGGLKTLRGAIDAMRNAIEEGQEPLKADRLFHEVIAHQAGNPVLARIVGELFDERRSLLSMQISARFEDRETWRAAITEHEEIYAALRAADPLRAESTMRMHLHQSSERWVGPAAKLVL